MEDDVKRNKLVALWQLCGTSMPLLHRGIDVWHRCATTPTKKLRDAIAKRPGRRLRTFSACFLVYLKVHKISTAIKKKKERRQL